MTIYKNIFKYTEYAFTERPFMWRNKEYFNYYQFQYKDGVISQLTL